MVLCILGVSSIVARFAAQGIAGWVAVLVFCQLLILGWLGSNAVSPQSEKAGGSFHSTPATQPQFLGLTKH